MTVLVAYDISDDSVRARCAAMLQAVGDRVQRSVYVCIVDVDGLAELRARIEAIINPDRDCIAYYRQCAACWDEAVAVGQTVPVYEEPYWAVL